MRNLALLSLLHLLSSTIRVEGRPAFLGRRLIHPLFTTPNSIKVPSENGLACSVLLDVRGGSTSDGPPKGKNRSKKSKSSKSTSAADKPKSKSPPKLSALAQQHIQAKIKSTSPNYRIQRELKAFLMEPPDNLSVKVGKNLRVWVVVMKGAKGTIYEGETFKLRVSFPKEYPAKPPSVYFLPPNIPKHEHVYTNGDICLSLLGKGWQPNMSAQSIAVSILSILSSAQHKSIPMDNARHAQNKPGEYQKDWVYHDDNC